MIHLSQHAYPGRGRHADNGLVIGVSDAPALPPRVLVVDDDATVAEVVVSYLRRRGMVADHVADGLTALERIRTSEPDLVILDLMLPALSGLEVCRRLRGDRAGSNGAGRSPAIIMLTARGEESDRVLGLELGADDYVTKPFSPRELVLRVESVLRRSVAASTQPATSDSAAEPGATRSLRDGGLVIELDAHRVYLDEHELALTVREFDLLSFLVGRPGRAYSRDELMREVWGWDFGDSSTVTVHVRRLREKVEADPSRPARLVTVWGVGYRWDGWGETP
jgi:DNA-binding response OmpR family regulator